MIRNCHGESQGRLSQAEVAGAKALRHVAGLRNRQKAGEGEGQRVGHILSNLMEFEFYFLDIETTREYPSGE